MNIGSLIIIAIALCIDSGVISLTVGLQKNIKSSRGLRLAGICALCQGGLFLGGILLGTAFRNSFDSYDHWIAFSLLAIIGVKMLLSIRKSNIKNQYFDVSHLLVLFGLGIATSIDAFIVGIGLGLEVKDSYLQIMGASALVLIMTFLFSILGFYLGRKNRFFPVKFSTALGGLVLIVFSLKILHEHGVF